MRQRHTPSMASDKELADAVKQSHTQLLVQILIEYSVDNGFLYQQWPIHRENLLLDFLVIHLGPLEQFFKVHGFTPLISLLIFSIAR